MTPKCMYALSALASASLIATASFAQSRAGGERTYTAALTGAAEVPGPGDPDGSGSATVTVNVPQREVCYTLQVSDIEEPTAAHIHEGPAGVAGGVVVTLETPTSGSSQGCESVDSRLAAQLLARPSQYYVNVHNDEFPGGAVRGQLG